jgi:hypothetical protein
MDLHLEYLGSKMLDLINSARFGPARCRRQGRIRVLCSENPDADLNV